MKKRIYVFSSLILVSLMVLNNIGGLLGYQKLFSRKESLTDNYLDYYAEISELMPIEQFSFDAGDNSLVGYLSTQENSEGIVVFSHGINSCSYSLLSQQLFFYQNGYDVLSYDSSGCNLSSGEQHSFSQSLNDLYHALDYIDDNESISNEKKYLFGFSWGGYATSTISSLYDKKIFASVCISSYNNPNNLFNKIVLRYAGLVGLSGCILPSIKYKYVKDNAPLAIDCINDSDIPFFIAHSKRDRIINYDKDSIICLKDKIENQKVTYYTEKRKGHTEILFSDNAIKLQNKKTKNDKENLFDYYEINHELMDEILDFFRQNQ